VRQGEAADTSPTQARDEVHRGLARHPGVLPQPAPSGDLGHPEESGGQELCLVGRQSGVLGDHLPQHERAGVIGCFDAVAHRGLVGEIALEDQTVGAVRIIDEAEVGRDRPTHALLVVRRGLERGAQCVEKNGDAIVKKGDVQIEFAGEVLIEHGLADACALGDVVHGGGVIALRDEDFAGGTQDLGAALLAGESAQPRPVGRTRIVGQGHPLMLVPGGGRSCRPASTPAPWSHGAVEQLVMPPPERWALPVGEVHVRRGGGGPRPAVFIHGLGGSALNWVPLMDHLEREVTSLAIDLPGFGMSPPPRDGDYSPAGHARVVAATIEEWREREGIDESVHVIGNSMGGAVALQLAARRPELVTTLTLVSPALPSLRVGRGNAHLPLVAIPGLGESLVRRYAAVPADRRVQATLDACTTDPERVSVNLRDALIAETTYRDSLPYAHDAFLRSLRGLLSTFADRGAHRPWRLARRVQQPVLAIYGEDDILVDARGAARVAREFRDADVALLDGCGHVAQMEHPETVARLWIDRFAGVSPGI